MIATTASRTASRNRHFFEGGKDLFQTKSPAIGVAISPAALEHRRQQKALRDQQALIATDDDDFIASLFETESTHNVIMDILQYADNLL